MAATAAGDQTSVSVLLRNDGDEPAAFEFGIPPASDLTLSPHVGVVAAHSVILVQVGFAMRLLRSVLLFHVYK